ncbi:hypothetical protein SYNPS1DRAFT_29531 [Syncephalis pseudoplumigaleata]|uniref:Uncharacterized protein n=1 Tax=Syncephalis pseudoplumigaleata TaxID=1712513 RepID=A0A4P9YZ86_9FUNG|nr:hypothetical protein SYNPS1DRAFT_29531 [Syncephalis pseudoplumigaleata]|eukprot:RKP24711.1 hypothetical protein SYNPS1DRAFT_29531 [Syncephalis pseudoplumigaleata]
MRVSLAAVSLCLMAAAASTFANPHAEPEFKLTQQTIDELNDNGFVEIFPHFKVVAPEGSIDPIYEPPTERPNTIVFKSANATEKANDCIQYVKLDRGSITKRLEKLTFVQCDNGQTLATVKLDRNPLGEVNEINVHDERFNRKEKITLGHTLFGNRLKKLKVERDWRLENQTTEVKVDRSIWSSTIKVKESQLTLS